MKKDKVVKKALKVAKAKQPCPELLKTLRESISTILANEIIGK